MSFVNINLHIIQPIIVQIKLPLKLPFRKTIETRSINQRSSPSLTSLARAPARHIIIDHRHGSIFTSVALTDDWLDLLR